MSCGSNFRYVSVGGNGLDEDGGPYTVSQDPTSLDIFITDSSSGEVATITGAMVAAASGAHTPELDGGPYTVAQSGTSGDLTITDTSSNESFVITPAHINAMPTTSGPYSVNRSPGSIVVTDGGGQSFDVAPTPVRVTAGPNPQASDITFGKAELGAGEILHFYSADGSIIFEVTNGSAVINATVNPAILGGTVGVNGGSVVSDNGDGTYLVTPATGAPFTIDTN